MSGHILCIEDEEDYQILIRRMLRPLNREIIMADTGIEGFDRLLNRPPDLLLLDVNLPDTTGYDLCRQIRKDEKWNQLPILMLTVRRRPEEWLEGFAAGANDYVSKPMNQPELLERVEACLSGQCHWNHQQQKPEFRMTQAVISGNRGAYDVLIRKYKAQLLEAMVGHTSNRAEAEDIVSVAFLRALERMDQFRGQSSFYTWLYSIAYYELSNRRRGNKFASINELMTQENHQLMADPHRDKYAPDESKLFNDVELLKEALSKVPSPYNEILDLYFYKEMSYHQLARHFDIPEGTVLSRLHKARTLLRKAWQDLETHKTA